MHYNNVFGTYSVCTYSLRVCLKISSVNVLFNIRNIEVPKNEFSIVKLLLNQFRHITYL